LEREVAISAVVLEQDKAIAFGLAVAAGDEAELLTIATDPSARRSGAAKLLLRFMTAEALVRGASRWILEVARDNEPARQFYRSEEFREIGVRSGYYARPGARVDAIVMSRP
jgi:ribosomal-protein-alanine N-acetyltransferase